MAEKTTRTVYGMYLQTCAHLGIPFVLAANTTLNELLGVQAGQIPDAGVYPKLGYLSLGNGGLDIDMSGDGALVMSPKIFQATSAAPYRPIPLILRPLGNDLAPADRAKYALRRIETRNSVPYIAYYLKRIDKTNIQAGMFYTTVVNGVKNTVPYVPDSSVLHPTPPAVSNPGVITADGTYVSASAPINVILDTNDVEELMNVFNIIYNNPNAAIISELALCSGIDKQVQITDPGGSAFNMLEAIAVQVNDLVNVGAPLQFNSDGTTFSMDIGATEPLFKTNVTVVNGSPNLVGV
jgi:hypothetical protein